MEGTKVSRNSYNLFREISLESFEEAKKRSSQKGSFLLFQFNSQRKELLSQRSSIIIKRNCSG